MAAIDKTYVTKKQYIEIKQWWLKTRKKQKRDLGSEIWLYPFAFLSETDDNLVVTKEYDVESDYELQFLNEDDVTLWNTSITQDMWLYKYCPFDYIKEQMKDNIGQLANYVDDFKFGKAKGVYIYKIDYTNNNYSPAVETELCFFQERNDEIYTLDRIIVYGTTYMQKFLYDVVKVIKGNLNMPGLNILFEYNGIQLSCNGAGIITSGSEQLKLGYISEKLFNLPKLKHSYSINDCKNYKDEEIFISTENECFNILSFVDFDRQNIKRYLNHVPNYIEIQK